MQHEKAKKLLDKFENGTLSESESAILESWYLGWPVGAHKGLSEAEVSAELIKLRASIPNLVQVNRIPLFPRFIAAASILIAIAFGGYYWIADQSSHNLIKNTKNIHPGTNLAALTLANGEIIQLNSAKVGSLFTEGNTIIKKAEDGTIIYNVRSAEPEGKNGINTISTPKGGQFKIILADGTSVWLNADSYLRFPSSFTGNQRRVELSGEAYFEVKKDQKKPFIIFSKTQTVEVLGTHFDISCYPDEALSRTTLLEGSVKLNDKVILKPGEQSRIHGSEVSVVPVDATNAVAWKEGKFRFENENIKDIMRVISRWYNVEILYQGEITHQEFSGSVSRFDEIAKVLDLLESTNTVHFKAEGRRITVMP
ncbi:FecR family protein [Pedobacter psychrodurus]|uniref:FecR family protein n=1 Tax=Pedobacter psychrodurus TaxID=2530456 RepID=A0A4R0PZK6_9SPHI|nr:FecR family protein [Pedobacter psychrodurus]TCD28692.1 FecR family protein [Pedobacter psychrodurus]